MRLIIQLPVHVALCGLAFSVGEDMSDAVGSSQDRGVCDTASEETGLGAPAVASPTTHGMGRAKTCGLIVRIAKFIGRRPVEDDRRDVGDDSGLQRVPSDYVASQIVGGDLAVQVARIYPVPLRGTFPPALHRDHRLFSAGGLLVASPLRGPPVV